MTEMGDTLIIEKGKIVERDIIPLEREDLSRKILIKSGAKVKGSVITGSVVEIELGPIDEKAEETTDKKTEETTDKKTEGTTDKKTEEKTEVTIVEGSILASKVIFKLPPSQKTPALEIGGDVIALSSIILDSLDVSDVIPCSIITVRGNLIASDMIRIANASVYGNIISKKVELANVLSNGILFLTRLEESTESKNQFHKEDLLSRLRNIVVTTIWVDENLGGTIELYGDIFIMAPILNFGRTSLEQKLPKKEQKKEQELPKNESDANYYIYLLNPSKVLDLLGPKPPEKCKDLCDLSEEGVKKDKKDKTIKETLIDHSLLRIPVREIQKTRLNVNLNLVSLLELEPFIQKRRGNALRDALDEVITIRSMSKQK